MSELDIVKEWIAYLKFWLVMMVIAGISLFGCLLSNGGQANIFFVSGCCLAVIAITCGIVFVHIRIEQRIEELREL